MTYNKCDLHLQEHPIVEKLVHVHYFQSLGHGNHDLVGIDHAFLGTFAFLLQSSSQLIFFVSWLFHILLTMMSSPLDAILLELKEGPSYIQRNLD